MIFKILCKSQKPWLNRYLIKAKKSHDLGNNSIYTQANQRMSKVI